MPHSRASFAAVTFAALAFVSAAARVLAEATRLPNVTLQAAAEFNLWPGTAPGETGNIGTERVLPNRPRPFDQLENVSVPTLLVFTPASEKRNGTAVLVIPGGGLDRLAIEPEGFEVAEWLNAQGITAFVLKYRVPARAGGPRYRAGIQDAQRAMGLIRSRAAEWQLDPAAIGSIGFSAGAEINVLLSVFHAEARQYPPVDAADTLSTRPDFNIAIYGGGFATQTALREDIQSRINQTTPPMFVAHAFDDAAMTSIVLMAALKRANIPSELHIFGAGAHGFGVRDSGLTVAHWRDRCLDWLTQLGHLDSAGVRAFARDFVAATDPSRRPSFSLVNPGASLDDAFAAQRRIVAATVAQGGAIAGYKGAFTTAAAMSGHGLKTPLHGVLFKAGRIAATAGTPVSVKGNPALLVETEIGYVIATDIGAKLRVPRQALTTVEALVPVIELPNNPGVMKEGKLTVQPLDAVAGNIGSNQFIVGTTVSPTTIASTDALAVSLTRGGKMLHATTGAEASGGQAEMLMALINQIVDQGHVLHRGDIVITGALGGAKPAEKGSYSANFGPLGKIEFNVE